MPGKNSVVQHTIEQSCVHVAPAVLFMSQAQLKMHFDDSLFFYFFRTSLKIYDVHNINFFQEICRCCSDIMPSGSVGKKSKVTLIKY